MMKSVKLGVLAASILQLSVLTVGLVSTTEQVMAQTCTGNYFNCVTHNGSWWAEPTGKTATAETTLAIGAFTWQDPTAAEKQRGIVSKSPAVIFTSKEGIFVKTTGYGQPEVSVKVVPQNMPYNTTFQGFYFSQYPNLILKMEFTDSISDNYITLPKDGATTRFRTSNSGHNVFLKVRVTALLINNGISGTITLPRQQIMEAYISDKYVGKVLVGDGKNNPPAIVPPKPKTCTHVEVGNRVFELGSVQRDTFTAVGQEEGANDVQRLIISCDNSLPVKIKVDDTNPASNQLYQAHNQVYLINKTGGNYATGVGVTLFTDNTTNAKRITIGQPFTYSSPTTQAGTKRVEIPFYARMRNLAGTNITTGLVQANARVTLSYK